MDGVKCRADVLINVSLSGFKADLATSAAFQWSTDLAVKTLKKKKMQIMNGNFGCAFHCNENFRGLALLTYC